MAATSAASSRRSSVGQFMSSKKAERLGKLIQNRKRRFVENDSDSEEGQEGDVIVVEGRRIVNISMMAEQMRACRNCSNGLFLHNIVAERRYGLGSVLTVKCGCGFQQKIYTGKSHRASDVGMPVWDVNSKCAMAMIHTGMGPVQIGNLFSALNIPPPDPKTLKQREREVGLALEKVAANSCTEALMEEVSILQEEKDVLSTSPTRLKVSFDGGWQRRGSGRSNASLSGHATLIGDKTGKCVNYGVKSKDCRTCDTADRLDKKPPDHDCRKNHSGSSKAMESELAVEMVTDLNKQGHTVGTIVMDDDSATIARINALVDDKIVKRSDRNHVKKCLSSELYKVKASHKNFGVPTIQHLQKNVSYAIAQNESSKDQIEKNIRAVVPHSFGDHSKCNPSWCKYLQTPDTYIHRSLPYKRPLKGEHLRKDLERVFNTFGDKAEKLADLGSSQPNESMNQIISTKAPKSKHFAGTESLNFRVSAAVSQKNMGQKYLLKVNESKCMSPGKYTASQAIRMDKKRKLAAMRQKRRSTKLKRLSKKGLKMKAQASQEVREGTTYQTGCGLKELDDDAIKEIPPALQESQPQPSIQTDESAPPNVVVFDLETTGFGNDADIIQIAALNKKTKSTYSMYINPEKPIHPNASKVTHLYKRQGVLYKGYMALDTHPKEDVLKNFLSWLPERCILAGHNSKVFDSKILVKALVDVNLFDEFILKCTNFLDTLNLCKDVYPNRKANGKGYSQEELVNDLIGATYEAHDAKSDVRALSDLLDYLHVSDEQINKHSFSVHHVSAAIEASRRAKTFPSALGISNTLVRRMAASGLELKHLKFAYERNGQEGIHSVLSENSNGHPRVTARTSISYKFSEYFVNMIDEK